MMACNSVVRITVGYPELLPFGRFVMVLIHNSNITHFKIVLNNIVAQKLIMVSKHIKNLRIFLLGFAQYLPDHTVVFCWPVPFSRGQAPAIDNVADQEKVFTTVCFKEMVEGGGFSASGA